MEICDDLGDAPTVHVLPVGNAGNITAYWNGYREYRAANQNDALASHDGFQAAGAAPIVLGHVVERAADRATAIRIGNPASWQSALYGGEKNRPVPSIWSRMKKFSMPMPGRQERRRVVSQPLPLL